MFATLKKYAVWSPSLLDRISTRNPAHQTPNSRSDARNAKRSTLKQDRRQTTTRRSRSPLRITSLVLPPFGPTQGPPKSGQMGLGRMGQTGPKTFIRTALGPTGQVQILVSAYPYHAPILPYTFRASTCQRITSLLVQETRHSQPDAMSWQRHTRWHCNSRNRAREDSLKMYWFESTSAPS